MQDRIRQRAFADPRREMLVQFGDAARLMRTYFDQRAREHGMTRAQWQALSRIRDSEGQNQADLADALEIQPISLVRLIDRLCEQGLVERRQHPSDRRQNLLFMTNAGRLRLETMSALGAEIAAEVFEGVPLAAVEGLIATFDRLKCNVRKASAAHAGRPADPRGPETRAGGQAEALPREAASSAAELTEVRRHAR
jgi:DNA-binding MarR family transcriptional regulator